MSEAAEVDPPEPPEERHPRVTQFEGDACEVVVDGEARPGIIRAVYQPAPDVAPDVRRAVVDVDGREQPLDIAADSDDLEVFL